MSFKIPKLVVVLLLIAAALLFWPRNIPSDGRRCSCIGMETAEQCYGIISACKYNLTVQEQRESAYRKTGSIELFIVLDTSKSMRGKPLEEAKQAIQNLLRSVSYHDKVSLIIFNEKAKLIHGLSLPATFFPENAMSPVSNIEAKGTTNYNPALELVRKQILLKSAPSTKKAIIFLSDGQPDDRKRPFSVWNKTRQLAQLGVCVYTVGYNIPKGSFAERTLKGMKNQSRKLLGCGKYFSNENKTGNLKSILEEIYSLASSKTEPLSILQPEMDSEHNTTTVKVKFANAGTNCYYSLNNGNPEKLFKEEFFIRAKEGTNLLTLSCPNNHVAKTLFTVSTRSSIMGRLKQILSAFETGKPVELTDDETRTILQRVLTEQNMSPATAEHLAKILTNRSKRTQKNLLITRAVKKSGRKTEVKTFINPNARLHDIDIYLSIPKCMAEKLNQIVFANENFRVISDDPLIMWHFRDLSEKLDISFEVLKEIQDLCAEELKVVPIASGASPGKHSGFFFRNLIPLLIIPAVISLIIFSEKEKDIIASAGKKGPVWAFFVIILLLIVLYPKPLQNETNSEARACRCIGAEKDSFCFGVTYDCRSVSLNTQKKEHALLSCSTSSCATIENYILLDDDGNPSFMDLDVTLVVDRSGSMKGDRLRNAKKALKGLVENLGINDRIALVRFDDTAKLSLPFTLDKGKAKKAVESIKTGGRTKYIPALDVALKNQLSSPSSRRPVVIFVSDGEPDDENRPWSIFSKVKELAQHGVCVHTIGYGNLITPNSTAELVLKGMAETSESITGCGAYHYASQDSEILQEIFSEVYEDTLKRGALAITDRAVVDYRNSMLIVYANVTSAFNSRVIPGFSFTDASCSPPAKMALELWKNNTLWAKTNFSYLESIYKAAISSLPAGNYTMKLTAASSTAEGKECSFRGVKTEPIEISRNLGFGFCHITSCSQIGDYIAYSQSFQDKIMVNITDLSFNPATLRVSEGTKIIWTNTGRKNHSVKSEYFSSPVLKPGEKYEFTIGKDEAGRYLEYYDPLYNTTATIASEKKSYFAFGINKSVDIMLVMDTSGSMSGTPMQAAKNASKRFAKLLYKADRAGIIQFSDSARIVHPFSSNSESLSRAIDRLTAGGGTSYMSALNTAEEHIQKFARKNSAKMVIFMSDGKPWDAGKDEILRKVKQMVSEGICLYTVGFGSELEHDREAEDILRAMADISRQDKKCGEYYYELKSAETLSKIFGEIYKEVLTLDSLALNASIPSLIPEDSSAKVSVKAFSRYNLKPIPGYDGKTCVPPARVKMTLLKQKTPLHEKSLQYSQGSYITELEGLEDGLYNINIEATALTSTGKECNFHGTYSAPLLVRARNDSDATIPVFNTLIIAISIASAAYYLLLGRKSSRKKSA